MCFLTNAADVRGSSARTRCRWYVIVHRSLSASHARIVRPVKDHCQEESATIVVQDFRADSITWTTFAL